jgi:hypothetical protein
MTRDERRRRLQQILDNLDAAAKEFRESIEASRAGGHAIRGAVTRMDEALARIEDNTAAANKAIDAMLAANRAARVLFNEDEERP